MVQLNPKYFPGGQSPLLPAGQTPVNTTPVATTSVNTAPVDTTPINVFQAAPDTSLLLEYIEKTGLSPVLPGWTNPSEAEMRAVVEGNSFRRTALKEFGNASYMTVYVDDGSRVPGGASFLSAKDIPYFKKGIVDLFYGWYQNPDQIWGTIEQWAGPTNTNADNRKGFMRDLQRYSSGEQQNLLNQWIQGGFGNPPAGLDADFAIDALDYAFREMGRGQQNKTRGFIDKFTNFVTDPMNWVKAIATAAVMSIPGGQGFAFSELGKSAGAELLKSATTQMAVDGTLDSLRPTPAEINDAIPEDATDNIPVERDEYLERVDYFQDPFTNYRPPIEDPGGTSEEVLEEIIEEPIVEEVEEVTADPIPEEVGSEVEVDPVPEKEVEIDPVPKEILDGPEVEVDPEPEAERTTEEVAGDIAVGVATDAVVDAIIGGQEGGQQAEAEVEQQPVSVDPNVETDADGNPLQDAAVEIAADAVVEAISGDGQQKEAEAEVKEKVETSTGSFTEIAEEIMGGSSGESNQQTDGVSSESAGEGVGEGEGEGEGEDDGEQDEKEQEELDKEVGDLTKQQSDPKFINYEFFEIPGRISLEFADLPELRDLDLSRFRKQVQMPVNRTEILARQNLQPALSRYPTSLSDMKALEARRKKFALGRSLLGG